VLKTDEFGIVRSRAQVTNETVGAHEMELEAGFPNAYLVMTNINPEEWCAVITAGRQIIGRAVEARIRISPQFPHVSRRHAEIWRERNLIKIQDLGSQSGTHINGVWVKDSRETTVAIGDRIWLGGLELEVVSQISLLAQVLAENGISVGEAAEAEETRIRTNTAPLPARYTLAALTHAELEILLWISRGYLNDAEIGKTTHRSPNPIRTQINSILRKLNVHSRGEIFAWLKRCGGPSQSSAT
jgi:DNA-binding CsgD family transcriptional regulator